MPTPSPVSRVRAAAGCARRFFHQHLDADQDTAPWRLGLTSAELAARLVVEVERASRCELPDAEQADRMVQRAVQSYRRAVEATHDGRQATTRDELLPELLIGDGPTHHHRWPMVTDADTDRAVRKGLVRVMRGAALVQLNAHHLELHEPDVELVEEPITVEVGGWRGAVRPHLQYLRRDGRHVAVWWRTGSRRDEHDTDTGAALAGLIQAGHRAGTAHARNVYVWDAVEVEATVHQAELALATVSEAVDLAGELGARGPDVAAYPQLAEDDRRCSWCRFRAVCGR